MRYSTLISVLTHTCTCACTCIISPPPSLPPSSSMQPSQSRSLQTRWASTRAPPSLPPSSSVWWSWPAAPVSLTPSRQPPRPSCAAGGCSSCRLCPNERVPSASSCQREMVGVVWVWFGLVSEYFFLGSISLSFAFHQYFVHSLPSPPLPSPPLHSPPLPSPPLPSSFFLFPSLPSPPFLLHSLSWGRCLPPSRAAVHDRPAGQQPDGRQGLGGRSLFCYCPRGSGQDSCPARRDRQCGAATSPGAAVARQRHWEAAVCTETGTNAMCMHAVVLRGYMCVDRCRLCIG